MKSACYLCVSIVAAVVLSPCSASSVILVEDAKVCYRRALAGKKVSRIFVRKSVSCERIEDCQQECTEEKRFTCEGFNYRLDPSDPGRGDCELLNVPYVRLELHRDIIPDPDYDYYEKDRNSYPNCKEHRPFKPSVDYLPKPPSPYSNEWYSKDHSDRYDHSRFRDRYDERNSYDERREPNYGLRPPVNERFDYRDRPYNRRNGYDGGISVSKDEYDNRYDNYDYSYHYLIPFSSNGKDYDDSHPQNRFDYIDYSDGYRNSRKYITIDIPQINDKWGLYGGIYGDFGKGRYNYGYYDRNYDLKEKEHRSDIRRVPEYWGQYGGSYGTANYHNEHHTTDFWKLNGGHQNNYNIQQHLNTPSKEYLPPYVDSHNINNVYPKPGTSSASDVGYSREPSLTLNECSLRTATGYRLYKSVVKKVLSVPTIYDCEITCFRQMEFICTSYAFRYVIGGSVPPNNCYLSDRNYKDLDYYTDVQQDHNFDIYTMNNREQCDIGTPHQRDSSECFLHVRSGLRLDDKSAKDSLLVKSIVDCEIACLQSRRFTCRTFGFRYGSPIIGGIEGNCQLTEIPYHKLDPRQDFVFDPGFVLYERASFGYGCEVNQLPSFDKTKPSGVSLTDELCYIGFGWPAKLLPEAVKKVLKVRTEEECKSECTRVRKETPFCCMSFSYISTYKDESNCFLSDIFQRDLLEGVDYIRDVDFWLFSWDNINPQCHFLEYNEHHSPTQDIIPGSLTWRIYSVGGWPCKRGSSCKQSELGFWFCELEGGSPSAWDYCCRPTHQCGYSEGFSYQWCYVGPRSTQWRKCNNKYYPYLPSQPPPTFHTPNYSPTPTFLPDIQTPRQSTTYLPPSINNIHLPKRTYLPPEINQPTPWTPWFSTEKSLQTSFLPPYRTGFRPNRPEASPPIYKPKPSLNEYEEQFDSFFLDPPKPGGFGQPRHWPVSYLHKEMPPNTTTLFEQKFQRIETNERTNGKPRLEAIQNLIEVIKTDDRKNIKYQITNGSSTVNSDILHVEIPLPSNFSDMKSDKLIMTPIDLLPAKINSGIVSKQNEINDILNPNTAQNNTKVKHNRSRSTSLFRKGFVEKANVTNYGRSAVKFL